MKKSILLIAVALGVATSSYSQTAKLQVIHNSADAIADSVDVYVNGSLLLDNFAFRTATSYQSVPAGVPVRIGVAPKNSMSEMDTVYSVTATLMANTNYIAIANGIVSSTGYMPATPFRLSLYNMGREMASNMTNTDVLVMHGATDAPPVDVAAGANTLVDNLSFGEFAPNYLELPTSDYVLTLTDSTKMTSIGLYAASLQTLMLQGEAIVVVASGFVDPAQNSNGPSFGLYAALSSGGDLVPLQNVTSVNKINALNNSFSVWPNPATDIITVDTRNLKGEVQVKVFDVAGKVVKDYQTITNNTINVSSLVSGVYFLQVQNDGKTGVQRFVKQ